MKKLFVAASVLSVLILALYTLTLHPLFPLGDSAEFQVVAKTFGINHPPGFPLYSLLSYVFALIPTASLSLRLNFLSALFGTAAVTAAFIFLYKTTKNYIAATCGALFLAFSHLFWLYSVITEVYTLGIFLVVLFLLLFVEWTNKPNKYYVLYAASFVAALSLMVQYVNIFPLILVAIFSLLFYKKEVLKGRVLSSVFVWFLLGLTPLLSIPLAASQNSIFNWDNARTLSGFFRLITRVEYQMVGIGENTGATLATIASEQLPYYSKILLSSFGLSGLVLAMASLADKENLRLKMLLLACFLFTGPVLISLTNYSLSSLPPDAAVNHRRLMEQVYIFSFPFVGILAGLGIHSLYKKTLPYKLIALALVLGGLSYSFLANYPKIASARNTLFRDYGENILQTIQKPTIVITGTEESNALYYLYAIEGRNRGNVRLITFSLLQLDWYVSQLKERYPDVDLPFEKISLGQKLDSFYEKNLQKFSIYFAPLDDQAGQSISDKFALVPYGPVLELVPKNEKPTKEEFKEKNLTIWNSLVGKEKFLNRQYLDLASNEVLMAYARAYTNVGLRSHEFGDDNAGFFFLGKAAEIQPKYYSSYLVAASIYLSRQDYDRAALEFEKVLNQDSRQKDALWNMAVLYDLEKDDRKAVDYAQRYINAASTLEEKSKGQKLLEEIYQK